MPQKLTIIDYGAGNLHSVYKKLSQLGVEVFITSSAKEIATADKIVLPGIGNFGKAIQHLRTSGIVEALHEEVIGKKKPVLGICLGMQLMAENSEEAPGQNGLGWFSQKVVRFNVPDPIRFKIPHIGWNQIRDTRENFLLNDVAPSSAFYFSHSYHFDDGDDGFVFTKTDYGYPFVSSVANQHIFGVQFHPEKSHDEGLVIFKNFLKF